MTGRYGCYDRNEFAELVTIGTRPAIVMGRLVTRPVQIPNFTAADSRCRYTLSDLGQADEKCQGCGWRA